METQFGVERHLKDRKQSREQKDDPCKVDQQGGAAGQLLENICGALNFFRDIQKFDLRLNEHLWQEERHQHYIPPHRQGTVTNSLWVAAGMFHTVNICFTRPS